MGSSILPLFFGILTGANIGSSPETGEDRTGELDSDVAAVDGSMA